MPSSIRLQNTPISSVPGAVDTETGLFLTGAFPGGPFGSIDGTCPWTINGGGARLGGVSTAGILGVKDGGVGTAEILGAKDGVAVVTGGETKGVLGDKDGSRPWKTMGGGAVLYGGNSTEVLGDKEGASPETILGTWGDAIGGIAGECKFDPGSNQKLHQEIWRSVPSLTEPGFRKLPFGWDAKLGASLLNELPGVPSIGGITERNAGEGEI